MFVAFTMQVEFKAQQKQINISSDVACHVLPLCRNQNLFVGSLECKSSDQTEFEQICVSINEST